jgi:release factor glutamine methyltransferase
MQKQILIAKLFDLDPLDVALGKYELDKIQKEKLAQSLDLLAQGMPIDYIVGEVNILNLKLKVTPQTLIPREETEFWLQRFKQIVKNNSPFLKRSGSVAEGVMLMRDVNNGAALAASTNVNSILSNTGTGSLASLKATSHLESNPKNKTLLDLGTGTGVIGLYLAECYQKVLMLDIDPQTLSVAKNNIGINNKTNCEVLICDGLLGLDLETLGGWDLVANLPYVPVTDLPLSQENKVEYEPQLAIYSGEDGLDLFYKVLNQIEIIKNKPQIVLFELDPRNIQASTTELQKLNYTCEIWLDQNGLERVLFGVIKPVTLTAKLSS